MGEESREGGVCVVGPIPAERLKDEYQLGVRHKIGAEAAADGLRLTESVGPNGPGLVTPTPAILTRPSFD